MSGEAQRQRASEREMEEDRFFNLMLKPMPPNRTHASMSKSLFFSSFFFFFAPNCFAVAAPHSIHFAFVWWTRALLVAQACDNRKEIWISVKARIVCTAQCTLDERRLAAYTHSRKNTHTEMHMPIEINSCIRPVVCAHWNVNQYSK